MNAMKGLSTSRTTGLGTTEGSGRRRVPGPPTRITAWIRSPPADALVDQARGADRLRLQGVAPVDDHVATHAGCDRGPVELEELGPLGDQHHRIGLLGRGKRRVAKVAPGPG